MSYIVINYTDAQRGAEAPAPTAQHGAATAAAHTEEEALTPDAEHLFVQLNAAVARVEALTPDAEHFSQFEAALSESGFAPSDLWSAYKLWWDAKYYTGAAQHQAKNDFLSTKFVEAWQGIREFKWCEEIKNSKMFLRSFYPMATRYVEKKISKEQTTLKWLIR